MIPGLTVIDQEHDPDTRDRIAALVASAELYDDFLLASEIGAGLISVSGGGRVEVMFVSPVEMDPPPESESVTLLLLGSRGEELAEASFGYDDAPFSGIETASEVAEIMISMLERSLSS